jgi:hypothetical protein
LADEIMWGAERGRMKAMEEEANLQADLKGWAEEAL